MVEAGSETYRCTQLDPFQMKQTILGFDQDDEKHWRAKLECGHYQHMRHDPPLRVREWILTEAGRSERIGMEVDCRKCDEGAPRDFDI